MHNYLRAIGFGKIKSKKQIKELITHTQKFCEEKNTAEIKNNTFVEWNKCYGEQFGLSVRGDFDGQETGEADYCFPFFKGKGITSREDIIVERHAEKESYAGACEDVKVGVSIIFYLQNVADYLKHEEYGSMPKSDITLTLSALSLKGNILLPLAKNEVQQKNDREASINRNNLIAAARKGDEDAIESLTLEDIDLYTMISRRIMHEDVFSIVDSYFMPYGMECDHYSVMGEILDMKKVTNLWTKEQVYIFTLDCNDLVFDVCINENDLYGEPKVGRRFKGVVWLQGKINFPG